MANSLSASFETIWAREQQRVFLRKNVALKIADTSFNSTMKSGQVLTRTYRSTLSTDVPQVYVRWTDITINDITDTAETLTVNRQFADGFYIDNMDEIQSKYDQAARYGEDYAMRLTNQVDAEVLGEVLNAANTVDAGSVGWTAGQGIALTTSNVFLTYTAARKKLIKQNVASTDWFAVISPEFQEIVTQYYASKNTSLGDNASENGFFAKIMWFDNYVSNNLTCTAVLSLATQPTNTDPITIGGVTFTFVSVIGTTAGNVLIGADVDATRANLATLINAPSTTTSTGVALSTANAKIFAARVSAANDNTADTLTVTRKWTGTLTVTETLTDATDTRTATKQKQHCFFGVRGNPVLVMQKMPKVQFKEEPKKDGWNILNTVLFGVKTFRDNSYNMVNVPIRADAF